MNPLFLICQSDVALEQHRLAKAAGEPVAIPSTRLELERLQRELGVIRIERDALALVKAAHASPMRLGTR